MNNIHTTSLNLILYTLLIICALSVPYSHFKDIKQKCDDTFEITGVTNGKCEYKMFQNVVIDENCAQDLSKSRLCQYTFQECFGLKDQEQYPLACYLCWVESPASTSLYQNFQQCINQKLYSSYITFSLILLPFIMMFI